MAKKDTFFSGDPAFNEKIPRLAFEIWLDVILGRDDSIIDVFFKGHAKRYGTHLKALKRRMYKKGVEINHHYATRLGQRRAEQLGYAVEPGGADFEADLIQGPMWGLPAPVAFESKWVTEASTVPYRLREFVYKAQAAGAKSCFISLYDALGVLNWQEMAALQIELSAVLPTTVLSFEKFTGRRIPTEGLRRLHSDWLSTRPKLQDTQVSQFQDLSRLEEARQRLREQSVSLLVGAGTTMAAGGPSWYGLITRLWLDELRGRYQYPDLDDPQAMDELNTVIGDSVLIQARMLRQISGPGFTHKVRDATYRGIRWDADVPRRLAQLAQRLHQQQRLHQLITFNYDSLIERALLDLGTPALPVYREERATHRGVPVRHVHGYLPPPPEPITPEQATSVVFDEETYHSRFNQPDHWTNRMMLSAIRESVCVFIGFSMTDPNVRRLLEQSREPEQTPHFVLLRQPPLEGATPDLQLARARLIHTQENILRELGLNIIWYSEYGDLPVLLELLLPDEEA